MTKKLDEIQLGNGILSFDGRVFERFGFGVPGREGTRMHVAQIGSVTLDGHRLEVRGIDRSTISAHMEFEEDQRAALEAFLGRVRAAAPNVEEDS